MSSGRKLIAGRGSDNHSVSLSKPPVGYRFVENGISGKSLSCKAPPAFKYLIRTSLAAPTYPPPLAINRPPPPRVPASHLHRCRIRNNASYPGQWPIRIVTTGIPLRQYASVPSTCFDDFCDKCRLPKSIATGLFRCAAQPAEAAKTQPDQAKRPHHTKSSGTPKLYA